MTNNEIGDPPGVIENQPKLHNPRKRVQPTPIETTDEQPTIIKPQPEHSNNPLRFKTKPRGRQKIEPVSESPFATAEGLKDYMKQVAENNQNAKTVNPMEGIPEIVKKAVRQKIELIPNEVVMNHHMDKNEDIEIDIVDNTNIIAELNNETETLKETIKDLQQKLAESDSMNESEKVSIDENINNFQEEINKLKQEKNLAIQERDEALKQQEQIFRIATAESEKAEINRQRVETIKAETESQINEFTNNIDQSKHYASASSAKADDLRQQLQQTIAEAARSNATLAEKEQTLQEYQTVINQLTEEKNEIQSQLEGKLSEEAAFEQKVYNSIEEQLGQHLNINGFSLAKIPQVIVQAGNKYNELQTQLLVTQQELENDIKTKADLTRQIDDLLSNNADVKMIHGDRLSELEELNDTLTEKITNLTNRLQFEKEESNKLIANIGIEISNKDDLIKTKINELDHAHKEIERRTSVIMKMTNDVIARNEQIKNMGIDLGLKDTEIADLGDQNATMANKMTELQNNSETMINNMKAAHQTKIELLENDNRDNREKIKLLNKIIKDTEKNAAATTSLLNDMGDGLQNAEIVREFDNEQETKQGIELPRYEPDSLKESLRDMMKRTLEHYTNLGVPRVRPTIVNPEKPVEDPDPVPYKRKNKTKKFSTHSEFRPYNKNAESFREIRQQVKKESPITNERTKPTSYYTKLQPPDEYGRTPSIFEKIQEARVQRTMADFEKIRTADIKANKAKKIRQAKERAEKEAADLESLLAAKQDSRYEIQQDERAFAPTKKELARQKKESIKKAKQDEADAKIHKQALAKKQEADAFAAKVALAESNLKKAAGKRKIDDSISTDAPPSVLRTGGVEFDVTNKKRKVSKKSKAT